MDLGKMQEYPSPAPAMVAIGRSITERLTHEKAILEERLSEVNAAIAALEKNPELQDLLDTIAKAARHI